MEEFESYFREIYKEFKRGESGELTFRSYLKDLFKKTFPGLQLSEENKKIRKVGKPDFTCFKKNDIKVGYIETKDIGIDLDKELGEEQLKKYSEGAIPNIILTDYMRFVLYRDQQAVLDVKLFDKDDLRKGNSNISSDKIRKFKQLVETFLDYNLPTIKYANELAVELSKRAKLLRELGKEQLEEDIQNKNVQERSSIYDFYETFRELIKESNVDECVDAYSQTITYGLFLAKIGSNNGLSRDSASFYIPSSIKIIKKIFGNITGDALPSNLSWIVDEIIDILNSADINKILSEFVFEGKNYKDPFIHFYEDFLKEYDPETRKHLGVYYTPEPVVSFITDSINEILKKEFNKSKGFADDSVKVLDFATGTGTFLANSFVLALREIRESGLGGIEREKIKNHLLKNFYGFEILVSPYVIAHLKLEVLLKKEGYSFENNERVQVYLTNTLSDPNETIKTLTGFMKELGYETKEANSVKKEKPILVVMGNPPYSVSSSNKSEWISKLMKDYKEELEERNIQPLDDDYIKFIRFAQWKIEQNDNGIVGIITNNGYLDGIIHREMRKKLMKTFNRIYILNLHGDLRKKERTPDGSKDENVFDIQQGVCIGLFIKNKMISGNKVFYADLYGKREKKYSYLYEHKFGENIWEELDTDEPYYFFTKKDLSNKEKYARFVKITDIFEEYTYGIKSSRDDLVVGFSKGELIERFNILISKKSDQEVKQLLNIEDTSTWKLSKAREGLESKNIDDLLLKYEFRPFDTRWIIYDPNLVERSRYRVMKNIISHENLVIICVKQNKGEQVHTLITNNIGCCDYITNHSFFFPLYTFNEGTMNAEQRTFTENTIKLKSGKIPNFKEEFINDINKKYNGKQITPEEILGYIYAVLYSPMYRKKYKEFLKIDFPSIPFVKDYSNFKKLSELGIKLMDIHLEKTNLSKNIAKFEIVGSNEVKFVEYKGDKVYINDTQYFGNIPKEIWNFWIGGYQVLDKWLKSRRGHKLSHQDIEHFVNIVNIINDTIKIMKEIDKIKID